MSAMFTWPKWNPICSFKVHFAWEVKMFGFKCVTWPCKAPWWLWHSDMGEQGILSTRAIGRWGGRQGRISRDSTWKNTKFEVINTEIFELEGGNWTQVWVLEILRQPIESNWRSYFFLCCKTPELSGSGSQCWLWPYLESVIFLDLTPRRAAYQYTTEPSHRFWCHRKEPIISRLGDAIFINKNHQYFKNSKIAASSSGSAKSQICRLPSEWGFDGC